MSRRVRLVTSVFMVLGFCVFMTTSALAGKVTLRVWTLLFDAFTNPQKADAEEYMAENPDVNIKLEAFPDFWTKMRVSLAAGTEGDVIYWMAKDMAPWFLGGFFYPLPEDIMTAKEIEDSYYSVSLNMWKWRGKYYGIPEDLNVGGFAELMVNLTLLHEYGYELPEAWIKNGEPGSFGELLAFAKEITVRQNGRVMIPGLVGFNDRWNAYRFVTLLTQLVGLEGWADFENKKLHYNTPAGKKALNFMYDMVRNQGIENFDLGYGIDVFITNRNAFMANAAPHWGPKAVMEQPDMEWTMLKFPPIFGSPRIRIVGGWGYAVGNNSAYPMEAWKYVKFVTTYEREKRLAISSGAIPPRKAFFSDPDIRENVYFGPVIEMLEAGEGFPMPAFTLNDGGVRDILNEEIAEFYMDRKGVEQALADAEARANKMIEELWARYGEE